MSHLRDAPCLRDDEVARLLALLDRDGEEARVVGGAGAQYVVATSVRRDRCCNYGAAGGGDVEHGTVTTIIDHHPVEVTTPR